MGILNQVEIKTEIPKLNIFTPWNPNHPRNWIKCLGYVCPTPSAIHQICNSIPKNSQCISVGSGLGLLERMIQNSRSDVCIDSVDVRVRNYTYSVIHFKCWCQVEWHKGYSCLMLFCPDRRIYSYESLMHFRGRFVYFLGLEIE